MWAIGDIQGCLEPLQRLLQQIPADDPLIFVGDLVNRGPESLQTLRFVRSLGPRAVVLLGNHDLHLLAVAAGIRRPHEDDTLQPLLDAPDRTDLLEWLRRRPLAHGADKALFVHAGVLPPWTREKTLELASEVETGLRSADWTSFLATMYGNEPARWSDALTGPDRARCVINALTRLRFVDADGAMNLRAKDGPAGAPPGTLPWFDHPARQSRHDFIVFGHWSTLGYMARDDVVCLDSGCVWGGSLTAWHWPSQARVAVPCRQTVTSGSAP